ncbi:MAG TPA: methyltransferase [Desulfovibrio sp.]|uniref:class I SAM-dependent methyltransferase n=1 Tax=Desulfovibrio TaxID=872 RepID=UPI00041F987C|nr:MULTISPECIES: methyltransferase [Desulfovibrio]MDY0306924.1 methyltransferase [Desulfovibrionaceae bacterium]HMM37356.1 methyltransferase [Desulfovibrio sp.]
MLKDFPRTASLEELLDIARAEFGPVRFEDVQLGDARLHILQIEDMPRYLDTLVNRARPGEPVRLPLWAKIWTSALILGTMLRRYPLPNGSEILEIGSGCGLCGLAAAAGGANVTLSDKEPAALLFSRINALKNGLADRVEVCPADFTRDRLGRRFHSIIGCEVLYEDAVYAPLLDFLDAHILREAGSEVVLAQDGARQGRVFFERAREKYRLLRKEVPCAGQEGTATTVLYRLGVTGS